MVGYTDSTGSDEVNQALSEKRAARVIKTASDLAWLNERPLDRPLRIGEQIRIPHQRFLDEGREARNKYLALANYARARRPNAPGWGEGAVAGKPDSRYELEARDQKWL